MKQATICFLIRGDTVALSLKKRGFGKDFLNGYGGKVQEGETPEGAAIRELAEECGIGVVPENLNKVAVIDFFDGEKPVFECHVFFVTTWHGDPVESEEMATPEWFKVESMPYDRMWKADRDWLPFIFSGKKIHGRAYYKPGMKEMDRFEYENL
jgi:8-oxo-dGTP pyrophosphatase MutT (NUDIX family)